MDNVSAAQTQPQSSKWKEVAVVCIGREREAIAFAQNGGISKNLDGLSKEGLSQIKCKCPGRP